jgi:hypothetical protein
MQEIQYNFIYTLHIEKKNKMKEEINEEENPCD